MCSMALYRENTRRVIRLFSHGIARDMQSSVLDRLVGCGQEERVRGELVKTVTIEEIHQ